MKIECDKCSAKYSIADEKVRGKTFKIRCKKCSNVIIVRDKAAADGGLGADEGAAAAGWHLAINGETVGPMGEDEVRQRFRGGEIDRDTAVWQEGFEDWVPLGDVETFADLAASAGASAAADPFASANQEDYAAAAAMHAGVAASPVAAPVAARAAGGGMSMAESPSSPRVTRLTGQRNENSVLFSLDSLQALATGGGGGSSHAPRAAAAPSRQGPRGLATVAPSSEGSGLIDIRALGAMVGSDAAHPHPGGGPAAKSVDDATLPSFGGANLGGLASTPLTPQVAAVDHMGPGAAAAPRSNAPIYVLMVLLLLVIVGLAAFVLLRKPEQVIVEKTVPGEPAPSVKGVGADDDDDDKDKDKKDEDEEGEEDADKAEGEAAEGEAAEAGEVKDTGDTAGKTAVKKSSSGSSSKSSSSGSSSKSTPSSGTSTPKPTPAPSTSGSNSLDVDCILDPNLPKCKGGGSSKPSSGGSKPAPAPADPSLPATLTTSDIKAGVAPVKDAAKSCGSKHNAKPGDKVKVKLSISGSTGAVTSASAEPPHQGTPLGNCVAAALKKATFKKFQKPSLGAVYPVSM